MIDTVQVNELKTSSADMEDHVVLDNCLRNPAWMHQVSLCLSVCLSISVCLSVCLSVCVHVCMQAIQDT